MKLNNNDARANDAHDELARITDELNRGKFIPNLIEILESIYDDMTPHFCDVLRRSD